MASTLEFLLPYTFSPTVAIITLLSLVLYIRGLCRVGLRGQTGRAVAFFIGVLLMYFVLQTHYDRWAQHMVFVHRAQHAVLHHLGPFLVALSAPFATIRAGVPEPFGRAVLDRILGNRILVRAYRGIQQPIVAALLFVGLVYFWLIPPIHFVAMLNVPLYNAMNWSMALDGLLFWHVMLDRREPCPGKVAGYALRLGLIVAVAFPQVVLGAYITFARHDLYPVYAVCGRLWPITPLADQDLGGLITWIPPAMMSFVGFVVVLSQWMKHEDLHGEVGPAAVQSST